MGSDHSFIDLSHTIEDGLVTYKGLPAPVVCDFLSREDSKKFYEPGTEFQIARIDMVANTGTYLDCPFHRFSDGKDLSQIVLDRLADLPGLVVRAPHRTQLRISVDHVRGLDVKDKAVIFDTGWDEHWRTDRYFANHPFLTRDAAEYLRDRGALLVGIDSHNIDDTSGNSRPVHTTLLGAGILIVEHLCQLSALPEDGFTFSAVPPKFKGVGTFPVRAFARINR